MFSRRVFLAVVLVCGTLRCEAAPSLSFNGVRLGQKWGEFLKAHPKVVVFPDSELPVAQQLAQVTNRGQGILRERKENELFLFSLYFFKDASLWQAAFITEPKARSSNLRVALNKVFIALGAPTSQGITKLGSEGEHQLLLVWRTPTQSAFAEFEWFGDKEVIGDLTSLCLVDAPWRATRAGVEVRWPVIVTPNKEDETRLSRLSAVMEQLRPGSTSKLERLKLNKSYGERKPSVTKTKPTPKK